MREQFQRTASLYGDAAVLKLNGSSVLIFGVGGVGSYIAETLARAGVGHLCLVDPDEVAVSNLNRQIEALHSTIGRSKAEVMAERIKDINPECNVEIKKLFYLPETENEIDFSLFDCVADAIDTVTAKIAIAVRCDKLCIPLISCMGTGNKTHPEMLTVTDIYKTETCPLARVMRRELKARGIKRLRVVYSKEEPKRADGLSVRTPSSSPFVPNTAGILAGAEIVNILLGNSQ